MASDSLNFN